MEKEVTISEAKNKLTAIVHAVEKGPSVKLTRRGRPVAVLLSIAEYEALHGRRAEFWERLTALRKQAGEVDITDEDFSNLRDTSHGREVDLN
jgi:prevent-host-death family protein